MCISLEAQPTSAEGSDSDAGSDEDSSDADDASASSSPGSLPPPLPPRRIVDSVSLSSDSIWEAGRIAATDINGEAHGPWCGGAAETRTNGDIIVQPSGDHHEEQTTGPVIEERERIRSDVEV